MEKSFLKRRALEVWGEAQRFHLAGELERAVDLYTKSIDIFPTAEAHTYRGWAYSIHGYLDDAIDECKRAIELDPSLGNPYNDIGSYLMMKGQLDEAIEWLERAKNAPRYEARHYPYMNLGRLYASRGMMLRGIREFEQALELQPGDPTCTAALELLRSKLN